MGASTSLSDGSFPPLCFFAQASKYVRGRRTDACSAVNSPGGRVLSVSTQDGSIWFSAFSVVVTDVLLWAPPPLVTLTPMFAPVPVSPDPGAVLLVSVLLVWTDLG